MNNNTPEYFTEIGAARFAGVHILEARHFLHKCGHDAALLKTAKMRPKLYLKSTVEKMKAELEQQRLAPRDQVTSSDSPTLVDAVRLLESIFPNKECRPTVRWLRKQQKLKTIPFVKLGRRVWFSPQDVLRALRERYTVNSRKGIS